MHRYLLCFALLAACGASHAQSLHKCSGQGGAIAYRDGECLPDERLVAVRDVDAVSSRPEPRRSGSRPTTHRRSTHVPSRPDAARDRGRSARGPAGSRKARKDPCAAAKQARDDYQRKHRASMTMEQLSRWSHRVYDACK